MADDISWDDDEDECSDGQSDEDDGSEGSAVSDASESSTASNQMDKGQLLRKSFGFGPSAQKTTQRKERAVDKVNESVNVR